MRPLRCPHHPRTKFAEVAGADGRVEVACRPCRRDLSSLGVQGQVIHVYDLAGKCLDTRVTVEQVPPEVETR